jgi:hypothetical protein
MPARMLLKDRLTAAMESAARDLLTIHCPDLDIEKVISDTDFTQYDPVKTKKKKKDTVSPEERSRLPFNPDKCHGRIWGDGFGGQCSCKPLNGGDVCKRHESSKFGLFNGPFPEGQKWKIPDPDDGAGVEFPEEPEVKKPKEKKPKEKKPKEDKGPKPKKKEISKELLELKEKYKELYGKSARGAVANKPEWLMTKIAEKEKEEEGEEEGEENIDEEAAQALVEKVKAMENHEEELEEDTEDLQTWEHEGVSYQRNSHQLYNENHEEVGSVNAKGIVKFLEGFLEIHKNDPDYEDPDDETEDESSDGE